MLFLLFFFLNDFLFLTYLTSFEFTLPAQRRQYCLAITNDKIETTKKLIFFLRVFHAFMDKKLASCFSISVILLLIVTAQFAVVSRNA